MLRVSVNVPEIRLGHRSYADACGIYMNRASIPIPRTRRAIYMLIHSATRDRWERSYGVSVFVPSLFERDVLPKLERSSRVGVLVTLFGLQILFAICFVGVSDPPAAAAPGLIVIAALFSTVLSNIILMCSRNVAVAALFWMVVAGNGGASIALVGLSGDIIAAYAALVIAATASAVSSAILLPKMQRWIVPELCPGCGYPRQGLPSDQCPECGQCPKALSSLLRRQLPVGAMCSFVLSLSILAALISGLGLRRVTSPRLDNMTLLQLQEQLNAPDDQVRYEAIRELSCRRLRDIASLMSDRNPRIRASAVRALQWVEACDDICVLLNKSRSDPSEEVVVAILWTTYKLSGAGCVCTELNDVLIVEAMKHPSSRVRRAAAQIVTLRSRHPDSQHVP